MQIDERIERTRAARRRAERQGRIVWGLALVATFGAMAYYGRFGRDDTGSPVLGVALLFLAVAMVGSSAWPNRHDEWHRRHVLQVAAWALAVVVAWHLGEIVWQAAIDAGYRARPAKALNMVAIGAQASHVLLTLRAEDDADDDSGEAA